MMEDGIFMISLQTQDSQRDCCLFLSQNFLSGIFFNRSDKNGSTLLCHYVIYIVVAVVSIGTNPTFKVELVPYKYKMRGDQIPTVRGNG